MDLALRLRVYSRVARVSHASRIPRVSRLATAARPFSVSAAASAPGTLPLEGYRVLDMTRVLAGVRSAHLN